MVYNIVIKYFNFKVIIYYNSFLRFPTHFWFNKKWDKSLPFTAKYVPTFYDFLIVWFLLPYHAT